MTLYSAAKQDHDFPKGCYSRGYLPHLDMPGTLQSITFRLADSMPQSVLKQLEDELLLIPISLREAERRKKIEQWLDAVSNSAGGQAAMGAEDKEKADNKNMALGMLNVELLGFGKF